MTTVAKPRKSPWAGQSIPKLANGLAAFPESFPTVPLECFDVVPPNPERLHQLIVRPYRIIYEIVDNEVHVLSLRHSRMLVTIDDTAWH